MKIGTCSWKYPSWKGLVYSEPDGANYLSQYAKKYSTVEIDQWFWSLFGESSVVLPKIETAREYAAAVPDDFRFTIKAPNSLTLTHFQDKSGNRGLQKNPYFLSVELMDTFLKNIAPLKEKIGVIMFQFEYLNRQKMVDPDHFLYNLSCFFSKIPGDYSYAIETRNPNYLTDKYFAFLTRKELGHVFMQGYYMPPISDIFNKFSHLINQTTVIRLHGEHRKEIEKKSGKNWSLVIEPRDRELPGIINIVEQLNRRGVNVYLNVNNHYEGSAPLTIEKIKKLLKTPL